MGSLLQGIVGILHPHYLFNFMLASSFFILKTTTPICYALFEDCELEMREWEMLTFLGCVIVLKNRKQPSYMMYIGTVCMFGKILNILLYLRQNLLFGVLYMLLCLLHIAFLPEPQYKGPDHVTYFRGDLDEELERDKRVTWLVEFYAAWQPTCVNFASTFAKLSGKYNLDNLKFGKVDVTRFPALAKKHLVDDSSWSKQLPTLVLFQGGKESRRRPVCDGKGKVLAKFIFSEENVVKDFELNELYLQCKKNPLKKRKGDLNAEAKEKDKDA